MAPGSSIWDRFRDATNPVVVTVGGHIMDEHDLPDPSSPTLLVVPVTDALKTLSEGVVTGSLDRETAWRVVGYQLDVATSHRLADQRPGVERIYRAVSGSGATWQARVVDGL